MSTDLTEPSKKERNEDTQTKNERDEDTQTKNERDEDTQTKNERDEDTQQKELKDEKDVNIPEFQQLASKSDTHRVFARHIQTRCYLYQKLQSPSPDKCDALTGIKRSCSLIQRIGGSDLKKIQSFRFEYYRPSWTVSTGKILRILVLIEAFRQRSLDDRINAYWKPFYVVCESKDDQELIAEKLIEYGFSVTMDTQEKNWNKNEYAVLTIEQAFKTRLWIRQGTGFVFIGYIRDLAEINEDEDLPAIKSITNPEESSKTWFLHRYLRGNVLEIQPV